MKKITHHQQRMLWEKEHQNPYLLQQMNSDTPSSGVLLFFEWLQKQTKINTLKALEMCCGKGRNCMWLAKNGIDMTGIDFSTVAINESIKRAQQESISVNFQVHDVITPWPFASNTFDCIIDCFGSTDIEDKAGRINARNEALRVLKPSGYFFVYTLSNDDEYHKEMIRLSPAEEPNAFYHPSTGKFEKVFSREELLDMYSDLILVEERRINKKTTFFNKEYNCSHFWMIFQKGSSL